MSQEKNFLKIKKSKNLNTIFGLPAESYTDHEFWKKECNTVLSDDWLFVGFVHELKNPGDVIPLSIAGKPIFLVKNVNNETATKIEENVPIRTPQIIASEKSAKTAPPKKKIIILMIS